MDVTKQLQLLNVISESPKELQQGRFTRVSSQRQRPAAATGVPVSNTPIPNGDLVLEEAADSTGRLNMQNPHQFDHILSSNDPITQKAIEDTAYNSFLNLFEPSAAQTSSSSPANAHGNVNPNNFIAVKRHSDLYSSHRGSSTSGGVASNMDSDHTSAAGSNAAGADPIHAAPLSTANANQHNSAAFPIKSSYNTETHYLHYLDDDYTIDERDDEDVEHQYNNQNNADKPRNSDLHFDDYNQLVSPGQRNSTFSIAADMHSMTIKSTANASLNTFETDIQHRSMINLDFYDLTAEDYNGVPFNFSLLFDKVVLIVNVASKCLMTKQYKELEELYEKYNSKGLEIIAFPSNQFFQEPKDEQHIVNFCSLKYSVTFPIMKKIKVNGERASPIYNYLKNQKKGALHNKRIMWNFEKFVIDKRGNVVCRESCYRKPKHAEDLIIKLLDE